MAIFLMRTAIGSAAEVIEGRGSDHARAAAAVLRCVLKRAQGSDAKYDNLLRRSGRPNITN
jgi:hypothetical protein